MMNVSDLLMGGDWHRHPKDSPDFHDKSLEGQRKVFLSEFLGEVEGILAERGLP